MNDFERGFCEELEKIEKTAVFWWVAPGAAFGTYDAAKAIKAHSAEGPRSEELKQKKYFTKYPTASFVQGVGLPLWGAGKALESYGSKGDTRLHRAASGTAGALGSWWSNMDPVVAIQKGVGL
jgi:hypothetical protein